MTGGRRKQHLFNGRRVRVRDLIEAGLLEPEASIYFNRPQAGEVHHATITRAGDIRLDDGQEYRSLSSAAGALAGGQIDGWHAWRTESPPVFLDALRQKLLEDVANADVGQGEVDDVEPVRSAKVVHEFLKDARQEAEGSSPVRMSVRELIARWNARGRDSSVNHEIDADLANHGLVTRPDFRSVTLDDVVALNLSSKFEEISQEDPRPNKSAVAVDSAQVVAGLERGLKVGNLPSASCPVKSIQPTATFDEAITTMLLYDYSQLAVMNGTRDLQGAVSWKSIAKARNANQEATLAAAKIVAEEVRYDKDLIDVLPLLREKEFVFVRGSDNTISGIVTVADVVDAYGDIASPFFLIGEIDQTLRRLIEQTFDIERVVELCDPAGLRSLNSFDQLTLGDYQRVLENKKLWSELGWSLDRKVFAARLKEITALRNNVMHFNPDPIPANSLAMLRHFLELLREYVA